MSTAFLVFVPLAYFLGVVETGENESDKVGVHELIVCLSTHIYVRGPHCDVRMTVVPSQHLGRRAREHECGTWDMGVWNCGGMCHPSSSVWEHGV